jgi:CheY-like chemotaxis protein
VSQPEAPAATILRLQRIRVLLVGTDRRFLRVAGALLASEGHLVKSSERPSEVIELVHQLRTDVAVIDASRSLPEAVRAAASLRGLPAPVAAVLVADRDRPACLGGVEIVRKWGSFDELSAKVEDAYTWRCEACL